MLTPIGAKQIAYEYYFVNLAQPLRSLRLKL